MPTIEHWTALARERLQQLQFEDLVEERILPEEEKFFPTITYPPQTMYPSADPETIYLQDPGQEEIPNAVYVHIPFCAHRCNYCHWVKIIDPDRQTVDDYLSTLSVNMRLTVERLGKTSLPVSTVLFGGGTPTFLKPDQLERMLRDFSACFDLSTCRQFSYEAEPASICGEEGLEKLKVLKAFGVNRISMGVQSFDDDILQDMGRLHSRGQIFQSIEQIRKAGIESICIDLIYGYPGLSVEGWIQALQTATSSGVDAWHLYRLRIIRHGDVQGPIMERYSQQPEDFPDVDTIRLMKMLGVVISTESGFDQHFTRIFATAKEHVTQFMWDYCCNLTNVVGVGPSAWANYHRTFTLNVGHDFDLYREMVRQGRLPIDRGLYRDDETEARRCLILPLKNDRVIKAAFKGRTGLDPGSHFQEELARLKGFGLLEEDEASIYLTPKGRFFADEVMMQLYQRRYLKFSEVAHPCMPD